MRRLTRNAKIALFALTAAAAVLFAVYLAGARYFSGRFFPGTVINGIPCGGMTAEEVRDKLQEQLEEYTLTLRERDGRSEVITGKQLEMIYTDDGSVDRILDDQKEAVWPSAAVRDNSHEVHVNFRYQEEALPSVLNGLACFRQELLEYPRNACVENSGNAFVIVPENEGNVLKREETERAVRRAVASGETGLDLEELGLYLEPDIRSTDAGLVSEVEKLNRMASACITYDFSDRRIVADGDTVRSWIVRDENGNYVLSRELAAAWVRQMAYETDTFGLEHTFTTSLGPTITLAGGGDYGWVIDRDTTTDELIRMVEQGENRTAEPVYLYRGIERGINDIGDTYVEVCIEKQLMWCYRDGVLVAETPVVTGNHATGFDTPSGSVWAIDAKKADAQFTLFDVKVDFWLPFHDGCGIHDSSWRSAEEYGGNTYLTNGSHGCVNTPREAAEIIFNTVDTGYPVVVYYSTEQVTGPSPTQEVRAG